MALKETVESESSGLEEARNKRVLVADDNPVNQLVAVKHLANLGCKADRVANGLEAVEAWRRTKYDLILMDCHMPELDGYDATRMIRNVESEKGAPEPALARIPIIALTAHALEGDREKCLSAGMDDYLSKPVKAAELKSILEKWL